MRATIVTAILGPLACGAAALLPSAGCAGVAREAGKGVAEGAAPTGVRVVIDELGAPENQASLARAGGGQGVQRLSAAVGIGIGRGAVGGAVDEAVGYLEGRLPIGGLPAGGPPATGAAAAGPAATHPGMGGPAGNDLSSRLAGLKADLVAAVGEVVGAAVRALSDGLSSDRTRAAARGLAADVAGGVGREAARAIREDVGPAAAAAVRDHVGPAVGQMLREQVVPAVGQAVRLEVAPAVGAMMKEQVEPAVRAAAKAAAAGVVDGLLEQRKTEQGTLAEAARQVAKGGALGARDAAVEAGIPSPVDPFKEAAKTLDRVMWLAVALMVVAGVMAIGLLMGMAILGYAVWKGRVPATQQSPPEPSAR